MQRSKKGCRSRWKIRKKNSTSGCLENFNSHWWNRSGKDEVVGQADKLFSRAWLTAGRVTLAYAVGEKPAAIAKSYWYAVLVVGVQLVYGDCFKSAKSAHSAILAEYFIAWCIIEVDCMDWRTGFFIQDWCPDQKMKMEKINLERVSCPFLWVNVKIPPSHEIQGSQLYNVFEQFGYYKL